MRHIKWFLLTAGILFGWLGWGLIKWANLEIAGLILFYFPALALNSLLHITATDRVSVLLTAALYGIIGFLIGLLIQRIFRRSGK
jgi:hypothetical protein